MENDVAGIAVHICARCGVGRPQRGLISGTVKDLVVGSGIEFKNQGSHVLKGVLGKQHLYSAERITK